MDLTKIEEKLTGKERRRFPRFWIETRMSLSVEDIRSGEPIGIGEASDLSMGGLRVRYLPVHSQVDIGNRIGVLLMDDDIFLFIQAEVIHNGMRDSYGVEFRDLTPADNRQLQRLVSRVAH